MRGFFGIGVYNPKTEHNIGTLWRTAHILGASFLFTIGKRYNHQPTDTTKAYRHVPLYNYSDIEELRKFLPYACQIVGIEINENAEPLETFCHPDQACYLLGAEDYGLPNNIIKRCHCLVRLNGKICFNVAVVGSIVIYHRVYLSGEKDG